MLTATDLSESCWRLPLTFLNCADDCHLPFWIELTTATSLSESCCKPLTFLSWIMWMTATDLLESCSPQPFIFLGWKPLTFFRWIMLTTATDLSQVNHANHCHWPFSGESCWCLQAVPLAHAQSAGWHCALSSRAQRMSVCDHHHTSRRTAGNRNKCNTARATSKQDHVYKECWDFLSYPGLCEISGSLWDI